MVESDVKKFYKDKNVFITGATGFVGLALVEKLLRTTEVGNIYLLIREKKGIDAKSRLAGFADQPVFKRLKEEKGEEVFSKLKAVGGDVGQEKLGMNPTDREELKNVINVVIHSAATLDFAANIKETTTINLLGTRRIIEFCRELTNLKILLHVSSAYVNAFLTKTEEKIYPVPEDADKVIEIASKVTDEDMEKVTNELLGKYVNTYTFTKALAEQEVVAAHSTFPTCIVRPSMIVAAWKEPVPGWTASKNGPQGFIMGAGKGIVRRLPADENLVADYIPVDVVVNGILVGAYSASTNKPNETPIYHLTSSTRKPFRWNIVTPHLESLLEKYPLMSSVWYPYLKLIPSLFLFKLSAIFFHWIPAYILDTAVTLIGKKPILVRLHTNIHNSLERLEPFIFAEWFFDSQNTIKLHNTLNEEDRENFGLDIISIDWLSFFDSLGSGVKQYLQHEPLDNVVAARKKLRIQKILNYILQLVVFILIWTLATMVTGLSYVETSYFAALIAIVGALL